MNSVDSRTRYRNSEKNTNISEFALGQKMNVEIKLATKQNLIELLPLVHAYHKFEKIELTDNECKNSIQQILTNKSLGGIWLVCMRI